MTRVKTKNRKQSGPTLVTTLGDLIYSVYNTAFDEAHDAEIARRLACHCARRAARHQPQIAPK